MNVNNLDLNLLKAFEALYQEQHVGRAAARIGLAQPSMSNALNRLRAQFDDPLFQRGSDGMVPTARADTLAPYVSQALAVITEMMTPSIFDPLTAEGDMSIAVADLMAINLAPPLMSLFSKIAPNLRVSFVPLNKRSLETDLDAGHLTLAIGTFAKLPARFYRKTILQDHFICIAGPDFSGGPDGMTLAKYVTARHILMTLGGGYSGVVDDALKQVGASRKVVMTATQFALLPDIVAQSDLIATIPASLRHIAKRANCQVFVPPVKLSEWDIDMVWTQKTASSPLGKFVIDQVQHILSTRIEKD